ncbi:MAG: tRNA (N(6)-L-threonylcarbamoyladenosine(37)-C(2))-methylthiotransferase MtaB [Thermoflavifilum sp.]|nr:tRNA (N(6)-L-threonylcarbamoyladenosine(37)-C(2))-methylthiotransferase MtaB [Thermoflavifilum sp.]
MKTVAFHTLGCKLNFAETSTLSRMLEAEGYQVYRQMDEAVADVYVINTCSVTEQADKECRQIIRRIKRMAPQSVVVVTGCYAQLRPQEIAAIEGVNLVLGAAEKFCLPAHLQRMEKAQSRICSCEVDEVRTFHSAYSLHDRTRTFLKVQDGCDYHCSFCTIPLARGKSRSNTIAKVLEDARQIAAAGVKEIVLTGVNLGDFGKTMPDDPRHQETLLELMQALDTVNGIERFRISSIEPNLLTLDIIQFVAQSRKWMPHFHIPLQSGSNRILGLMRRRYRRELYAEKVHAILQHIPDCAIGVDVIVGFPTETDADFQQTFDFLQSLPVAYLHVFTYSERANTPAISLKPSVPPAIRHQRNDILRKLSAAKHEAFVKRFQGTTRPVLFEAQVKQGMMEGYTDNYIRVQAPYRESWINRIIDWTID